MAIRDIFKKKGQTEEKVKEKKEEIKKETKSSLEAPRTKKELKFGEAYRVLKTPHITEKATDLVEKNQYIFKVWPRANKVEIKKAIADLYGVEVIDVNIINVPPKKRRLGRVSGWREGYKKAIVKIKEGQKIEVLPR